MDKKSTKPNTAKKSNKTFLDFSARNYQIFGVALVVIVLGYFAMAQPPAEGAMSLTVAPILLVIGYCILIPLSIFWRPKKQASATTMGD